MQSIEALNQALFLAINATPATPRAIIAAALFIANNAIGIVPLVLIGLWLTGSRTRRETALRACLVGFLALGINQLIGLAWYHPRPFAIGLGHTFLPHAPDSSFPSDHATLLSAMTLAFFYGAQRRLGWIMLAIDVAVAWARVFVGVHFPFDMFGAAIIACLTYIVSSPLWRTWGQAATDTSIVLYRKILAVPIARGWLR